MINPNRKNDQRGSRVAEYSARQEELRIILAAQRNKRTAPARARNASKTLRECDEILDQHQDAFYLVIDTVRLVRDEKLWRSDGYRSFEDWCERRHGWTRQRGHQMAQASEVRALLPEDLSTVVDNEAQLRALAKVPKKDRPRVLRKASESGAVTGKSIREAAGKSKPKVVEPEIVEPEPKRKHNCPTCRCE